MRLFRRKRGDSAIDHVRDILGEHVPGKWTLSGWSITRQHNHHGVTATFEFHPHLTVKKQERQ